MQLQYQLIILQQKIAKRMKLFLMGIGTLDGWAECTLLFLEPLEESGVASIFVWKTFLSADAIACVKMAHRHWIQLPPT